MPHATPESNDSLDAHDVLVESALPLVFDTYDDALGDGMPSPLVVLVDCEDELGGQIARGWLGEEAVDDAIALEHADAPADVPAEADGADASGRLTTVFARAVPWDTTRGELSAAFPYLADALAAPPEPGGVLVVAVTAGGAALMTAPDSARE